MWLWQAHTDFIVMPHIMWRANKVGNKSAR